MSPAVGWRAPDFTARNQHGELITLSALRGAPVALIFYPWAFSGICTGELNAMREELGRFEALGTRVLAISCDAMFTLRAFAEAEQLEFDLLSDHWPHGEIAQAYGVFEPEVGVALRGTFVLDAEGIVTWQVVNGIGDARDLGELLETLAG